MSLLTDTDLNSILDKTEDWSNKDGNLQIFPFDEKSLTPIGYDLRVGARYSSALKAKHYRLHEGDILTVLPKDTVLITTMEKIGMPQNRKISGFILSKVSKASKGLSQTSTTIDADWKGHLLIAIHNYSSEKVELHYGEEFCTVVFISNQSAATKECGKSPDRLDILVEEWETISQKANRKTKFKSFIPPGIIFSFLIFGYFFFGNTSGFIAIVAASVGFSKLSETFLK